MGMTRHEQISSLRNDIKSELMDMAASVDMAEGDDVGLVVAESLGRTLVLMAQLVDIVKTIDPDP